MLIKRKLAIYHPWIYLYGGIERTLLELIRRSRHEWTIFTSYFDPQGTFPELAALDIRTLQPTNVGRDMFSVLKSAARVAFQKLPLHPSVDGVVVCCEGIGDLITFRNHSRPIFNLCFTPLRAAFDPTYEEQALTSRRMIGRALYKLFKHGFRFVDRRAWRHYQNVIAISGEVRSRILAGRLFDADRISVVHPGIDWSPVLLNARYEPFCLLAGRIMWTKNIELAIRAFLDADVPAHWKLVVAGYVDKKSESYLENLRAIAFSSDKIEFVLSPSDEVLSDLLRRASFCLFTPLNEDWGIVPLEAMAQAKLTIANNSGGPRESIIDGHSGYLLPPLVSAWSSTISHLIRDPSLVRQLGSQAHADVERFTWKRFVNEVDDAIERWLLSDSEVGSPTARNVFVERMG
jgi:glycosyltransferase involved in cell wall biosynthesis